MVVNVYYILILLQVFLNLIATPEVLVWAFFSPSPSPFYLKHHIIYYTGPAGISLKDLRAVLD